MMFLKPESRDQYGHLASCDRATHLAPPNSIMDQKSFKIEICITKVQLEQGLLPYCNLPVKCWRAEFPCIPMRNLGYILDPSWSLMHDTPL